MPTKFQLVWFKSEKEARQHGREQGREQDLTEALEQPRGMLSGLAACRFGERTATHLMAVQREVKDPERLLDMSGLMLDCATGRELLACAERVATGRIEPDLGGRPHEKPHPSRDPGKRTTGYDTGQ